MLVPRLVAAAAGAVLVAACGLIGDDPRLVVIGDSITHQSSTVLPDALEGWDVTVDGVDGATIPERMDAAREFADAEPDAVVVNLGTNDTTGLSTTAVDDMRGLLALFPNSCRVVVTVTETRVEPGVREAAVELNDYLRDGARRGRWLLADWDALVKEYYAAGEPEGSITVDTIHPTPMGRARLARLIEDALHRC